MLDAFTTSLSALQAFDRKLGVTAHNVANVNTDGFRPQRVQMREEPHGGVQARVQAPEPPPAQPPVTAGDDLPNLSAVELPTEMTNLVLAKRGYQASIKAMQTAEEMDRSLLDILG